jgi:RNA polymerase sigma-70 factor, ECF subfamily
VEKVQGLVDQSLTFDLPGVIMENVLRQAKITGSETWTWETANQDADYARMYEASRHRIYFLAFCMAQNEMKAEGITYKVFQRAFVAGCNLNEELLDRILVSEIRELMPVGVLTLEQPIANEPARIRGNVKKVHLEEAVMKLPATERIIFLLHDVEGHDHARISRTLNVTEAESQVGLHAARLRLRELLANMM